MMTRVEVKFRKENGIDAGRIKFEYFAKLRNALSRMPWKDRHIFEFGENCKLLTCLPSLLSNRSYYAAGLATADLIWNTGKAFEGVHPMMIHFFRQYLEHKASQNVFTAFDVTCSNEVSYAFSMLHRVTKGEKLTQDETSTLTRTGRYWDVKISNWLEPEIAVWYKQELARQFLWGVRIPAIYQYCEGLKDGKLLQYLKNYDTMWENVFPRVGELNVSIKDILKKVRYIDAAGDEDGVLSNDVIQIVSRYLDHIQGDDGAMRNLLSFWTGGEWLPEETLKVVVTTEEGVTAVVCSNELNIAFNITYDDFVNCITSKTQSYNKS